MSLLEPFRKKSAEIDALKEKLKILVKENKILREEVRYLKNIFYNWNKK
jgi:regulator of replication initiation timing